MARKRGRRKLSMSERVFYIISLLLILSMVLGLVAAAMSGSGLF